MYYAEHAKHCYSRIIGLDASDKSKLLSDLCALAIELNLCPKDTKQLNAAKVLKSWLEKKENSGWLIILEDIDNFAEFIEHLPANGGHIIGTTRRKMAPSENMQILPVDELDVDEAFELVRKRSHRNNLHDEQLYALINRITRHALVLETVSGFLSENPEITIEEFLTQEATFFPEIIRNKNYLSGDVTRRTIATIFQCSIHKIREADKKNKRAHLAEELLHICSCLCPANIPRSALVCWLEINHAEQLQQEPDLLMRLVEQVEQYSLIKYDTCERVIIYS